MGIREGILHNKQFMQPSRTFKVGLIFLLVALVLGSAYLVRVFLFKASIPYKLSATLVTGSPEIVDAIGPIISLGHFPRWNVHQEKNWAEAHIEFKVIGQTDQGEAEVWLYQENGIWLINDAVLRIEGKTELSLIPLELVNFTFHSESSIGPLNESHEYELGEDIFIKLVLGRLHRINGRIKVKEGITVKNDKGKEVYSNPSFMVFDEQSDTTVYTFENTLKLDEAGTYHIAIDVADELTGRVERVEDKIKIVEPQTVKIRSFQLKKNGFDGVVNESGLFKEGEVIYASFQVMGFNLRAGQIAIGEDLFVLDVDDNPVWQSPNIASLKKAWARDEIVLFQNKIESLKAGSYKLKVIIRDENHDVYDSLIVPFKVE